jgi:hypothetical protein
MGLLGFSTQPAGRRVGRGIAANVPREEEEEEGGGGIITACARIGSHIGRRNSTAVGIAVLMFPSTDESRSHLCLNAGIREPHPITA